VFHYLYMFRSLLAYPTEKKLYNFLDHSVLRVCTSCLPPTRYLQPPSNCNSDCTILDDLCTWRVPSFMYDTQTVLSSTMQPIWKESYWVLFNALWRTRWMCLEYPLLLHFMIQVIDILFSAAMLNICFDQFEIFHIMCIN